MLLNLNATSIWSLVGLLFTVPVLAWLWSLVTISYFKKLGTLALEMRGELESYKAAYSDILSEKADLFELKAQTEARLKEIKEAYKKMQDLVAK